MPELINNINQNTPAEKTTPEMTYTDDGIPMFANGIALSETAINALREARARAAEIDAKTMPTEQGGRKDLNDFDFKGNADEPTRYNDWEKSGRAVDF